MRSVILFIVALFCTGSLLAQDLHFSQFYAAPMLVNPSYTGNFDGNYRVGANARSQWASVTEPYETLSVYGDVGLGQDALNGNWVGAGLGIFMDRAGDGVLSNTKILGNVAFHKTFNREFYVSFGVSGGYVGRRVDFTQLLFDEQWNESTFDPNLANNESVVGDNFGYFVLNSGLSFNYEIVDAFNLRLGASLFHVNRPEETFFTTINVPERNKLGLKPTFSLGASAIRGMVTVEPAVHFATQKKASFLIGGSNFAFQLSGDQYTGSSFHLGAWYRWKDAAIAVAGFQYNRIRCLISYDVTLSELSTSSNGRGNAYEISIVHVGGFRARPSSMNCPRF